MDIFLFRHSLCQDSQIELNKGKFLLADYLK